jgi:hypothetical protein
MDITLLFSVEMHARRLCLQNIFARSVLTVIVSVSMYLTAVLPAWLCRMVDVACPVYVIHGTRYTCSHFIGLQQHSTTPEHCYISIHTHILTYMYTPSTILLLIISIALSISQQG